MTNRVIDALVENNAVNGVNDMTPDEKCAAIAEALKTYVAEEEAYQSDDTFTPVFECVTETDNRNALVPLLIDIFETMGRKEPCMDSVAVFANKMIENAMQYFNEPMERMIEESKEWIKERDFDKQF